MSVSLLRQSMLARLTRVSRRASTEAKFFVTLDASAVGEFVVEEVDVVPGMIGSGLGALAISESLSSCREEGTPGEIGEGEEGYFSSSFSVVASWRSSVSRGLLFARTPAKPVGCEGGDEVGARDADNPPLSASLHPTFLMGCAVDVDGGGSSAIAC